MFQVTTIRKLRKAVTEVTDTGQYKFLQELHTVNDEEHIFEEGTLLTIHGFHMQSLYTADFFQNRLCHAPQNAFVLVY